MESNPARCLLGTLVCALMFAGCVSLSLPERMVSSDAKVREAAFAAAQAMPLAQRDELVFNRDLMDLCLLSIEGDGFEGTQERAFLAMEKLSPESPPLTSCMRYAESKCPPPKLLAFQDRFHQLLAGVAASRKTEAKSAKPAGKSQAKKSKSARPPGVGPLTVPDGSQ